MFKEIIKKKFFEKIKKEKKNKFLEEDEMTIRNDILARFRCLKNKKENK
jgi:hypothetical protein